MEFQVKHLGPIREATINLDRPLTVFCGANGTGKTYLSFIIEALTSRDLFKFDGNEFSIPTNYELSQSMTLRIDVDLIYELKQDLATKIKSQLNTTFGLSDEDAQRLFSRFEINFAPTLEQTLAQTKNLSLQYCYGFVKVIKRAPSLNFTLEIKDNTSLPSLPRYRELHTILVPEIYRNLVLYPITQSIILPTERNTTNIFNKELSLSRNELTEVSHTSQPLQTLKMAIGIKSLFMV